jgi:hypothetical protein
MSQYQVTLDLAVACRICRKSNLVCVSSAEISVQLVIPTLENDSSAAMYSGRFAISVQ